ncbi:MAG: hypothetical protein IPG45_28050 [Deltaproteobacteria bacterium]|nr:hypothetical protein [Deltaproteobacteria bacterium]
MLLEDVLDVDDVDLFAVLELVEPRLQLAATAWACSVGLIKQVEFGHGRQVRLRRGAVTGLRLLLLGRFVGARPAFALVAVGPLLDLLELLLEDAQALLDGDRVFLLGRREFLGHQQQLLAEAPDLRILNLGDCTQELKIGDAIEVHHARKLSYDEGASCDSLGNNLAR